VRAGDSVGGQRTDAVHGSVVARKGNQLICQGRVRRAPRSRRRLPARRWSTSAPTIQGAQGRLMQVLDATAIGRPEHRRVRHVRRPARGDRVDDSPTLTRRLAACALDVAALRGSV
jgi:hypothetical protein